MTECQVFIPYKSGLNEKKINKWKLLSDNYIKSVGSDAFSDLVTLTTLDFSKTELGQIKDYAFRSTHPETQQLNLILTAELILKTDFSENSLKASNRALKVVLISQLSSISFHLNETYFKPFLNEKKANSIRIEPKVKCNESGFFEKTSWLLNNPIQYKEQVFAKCQDGTDLLWLTNSTNWQQRYLVRALL